MNFGSRSTTGPYRQMVFLFRGPDVGDELDWFFGHGLGSSVIS